MSNIYGYKQTSEQMITTIIETINKQTSEQMSITTVWSKN